MPPYGNCSVAMPLLDTSNGKCPFVLMGLVQFRMKNMHF
jgi:hypothetical protein